MSVLGPAIAILRLMMLIVGVGLTIASMRHITDGFPGYGSETKQNRSVWSQFNIRTWFTPRGFKLHLSGLAMITARIGLGLLSE